MTRRRRWVGRSQPFYDYPARPQRTDLPRLLRLAWRHYPGYWVRLADDIAVNMYRQLWGRRIGRPSSSLRPGR